MSKISTNLIQSNLLKIGHTLGFNIKEEYTFEKIQGMSAPRYDVVWLLDVSELDVHKESNIPLIDSQYMPFAAFEIEGQQLLQKIS